MHLHGGGWGFRYSPTLSFFIRAMVTRVGGGGHSSASLYHPLIRIHTYLQGGGLTQEGLLPPPLLSPCTASNPTAGLPAPSDPNPGCGASLAGVVVAPPLACQKLFTSPRKYTRSDGITWGGGLGIACPRAENHKSSCFFCLGKHRGVAGTALGSRNAPIGWCHRGTQGPWSCPIFLGFPDRDVA